MSSETRTFRPYDIDERLAGVLHEAEFSYGDLRCGDDSRILIEDHSFAMRTPILSWSPEKQFDEFKRDLAVGATSTGIDKSLLCLVVTARSTSLKLCELVFFHSLDDLDSLDRVVRLGDQSEGSRRKVFAAETHGAVVDAYVTLGRSTRGGTRRPSREGTWLAHASFRIECQSDSELFRPRPLDKETRERLRLGKDTVRFIEFEGHELAEPLASSETLTFWVDEQLLTVLDSQRNSPVAQHLQRQMAIDFISGAVHEFARLAAGPGASGMADEYASLTYEETRDSLIGKIVRFIAGPGAAHAQRDQVLKTCRLNPQLAIALAEDAAAARITVLRSLEP